MTDEKKIPHADDDQPITTREQAENKLRDMGQYIREKVAEAGGDPSTIPTHKADDPAPAPEATPPGFMNTERVISHMLGSLKGVDLTIACEATTVVLCELTRVLNKGDHREAQLDVFRNVLAFFQRFPDTSITGISVTPHSSGPVQ